MSPDAPVERQLTTTSESNTNSTQIIEMENEENEMKESPKEEKDPRVYWRKTSDVLYNDDQRATRFMEDEGDNSSQIADIENEYINRSWTHSIYHGYMYGLGSVFLLYMYFFMIYTAWWNKLVFFLHEKKLLRNTQRLLVRPVNHNGDGAGTLYLRLGAVLFGSLAIVLFGLEIFLCANEHNCQNKFIAEHVLSIIFILIQMHFIYCNSKVSVTTSRFVCKVGFMHLVAVNLWTWIRFVVAKQQAKQAKKDAKHAAEAAATTAASDDDYSGESSEETTTPVELLIHVLTSTLSMDPNATTEDPFDAIYNNSLIAGKEANTSRSLSSIDYLGDIATILTTCLVEYATVGAAVMFILWKSVDAQEGRQFERVKRKSKMRIDCSQTSTGIFLGLAMLVLTCVFIGINSVYEKLHLESVSRLASCIYYVVIYGFSIIGISFAMWRMRNMQYKGEIHGESLDQILIVVGMIGEFLYCSCELDMYFTGKGNDGMRYPVFVFVTFIVRLAQVVFQSTFILMAFRLAAMNAYEQKKMAGKQTVTYLLVTNVSLFIYHIYEGISSSVGFDYETHSTYQIILVTVTPIIVFYRFHSSVCFAEIWKHAYSTKAGGDSSATSTVSFG